MAIAVVSGRVYGMFIVRRDVVFGKIGADVGFDDAGHVL